MEFEIESGVEMPKEEFLQIDEFYNLIAGKKYTIHYRTLVERAPKEKPEGYTERHHVIPKCLKGSNYEDNLVYLTAREHFIAHQILCVLFPKVYSLAHAAQLMTVDALGNRVDNRLYGWLRERVSEAAKNRVYSEEARLNMSNGQKNRIITPEQMERMMVGLRKGWETPITEEGRARMSLFMKGRVVKPETLERMRLANLGKKATPETIAKMSESRKNPSAEVRENMAAAQRGRKHIPETIAKIAYNNSIRGTTQATRDKMSISQSNKSDETKALIGAASKIARQREKELGIGMYSPESIAKRSISIKESWARRKAIVIETGIECGAESEAINDIC
jgi:hypothetical protein